MTSLFPSFNLSLLICVNLVLAFVIELNEVIPALIFSSVEEAEAAIEYYSKVIRRYIKNKDCLGNPARWLTK